MARTKKGPIGRGVRFAESLPFLPYRIAESAGDTADRILGTRRLGNKAMRLTEAEARRLGLIQAEPRRRPSAKTPRRAAKKKSSKGIRRAFKAGAVAGRCIGRTCRAVARGTRAAGRGFLYGIRQKNPGEYHVAGLPLKYQHRYEEILHSPGFKKRYGRRAKSVAAAESWTQYERENPARAGSLIPAWKDEKSKLRVLNGTLLSNPTGARYKRLHPSGSLSPAGKWAARRAREAKKKGDRKAAKWWTAAGRRERLGMNPSRLVRNRGKKAATGRRTPNPATATEISEMFHGREARPGGFGDVSDFFPGKEAAVLGRLDYIDVIPDGGYPVQKIDFPPTAKLIASRLDHMAIAGKGTQFAQRANGKSLVRFGQIKNIGYTTDKPHLYNTDRKMGFKHKHGEETGKRPVLYLDHEGRGIIKGGRLQIKREGITD